MENSEKIDWSKVIAELLDGGLTQAQIARELNITQTAIYNLWKGKIKQPVYSTGRGLLLILKRVRRSDKKIFSSREKDAALPSAQA